jgi:hypothetical protein
VRRNMRVRISQRTTFAHWLVSSGKSRQLCTQRLIACPITVSDVGRTTSGSSSLDSGSGINLPLPSPTQPMMGDDRHLLGEAIDMIGLLLEEGQGDEQRKIAILDARRLDPRIHQLLDALPDAIAPGADHHAAAHARFLRQIGLGYDRLIPCGEILGAGDGKCVFHGMILLELGNNDKMTTAPPLGEAA